MCAEIMWVGRRRAVRICFVYPCGLLAPGECDVAPSRHRGYRYFDRRSMNAFFFLLSTATKVRTFLTSEVIRCITHNWITFAFSSCVGLCPRFVKCIFMYFRIFSSILFVFQFGSNFQSTSLLFSCAFQMETSFQILSNPRAKKKKDHPRKTDHCH